MARSFTLRKVADKRGNSVMGATCEGYNATTGLVVETQYSDTNGDATFTTLPDAGTVTNIKISWGLGNVEWRPDIFLEAVPISAFGSSLIYAIVFGG